MEMLTKMSLGKAILGLRVEALDGSRLDILSAIKRRVADVIDFGLYAIPAFIAYRKTERRQRLGDLWADAVVLRGRPEQAQAG